MDKKYDLFIQEVNKDNIIKKYSIYDEKYDMGIECISHLKVEAMLNYADFYKLVDGNIIKLTQEEIQKWKEENEEPSKTKICTMEDLQEENKKLWDTVEYLLKQTEAGIPKEEEEVI